jgi:hypothetical protein
MSLDFDQSKYHVKTASEDGISVTYKSYEGAVYVEKPVDVKYHSLNVYVPENAGTANKPPIFFANAVGGYMPSLPAVPGKDFKGRTNAAFAALARGYVVVCSGVRGRGLTDEAGKYIGGAPACIVDLKAAVRYMRRNKDVFPGDTERIITNGTSAGGALSLLLGASGNSADYEPYLMAIGAADERDDVFASSCYCPITNLENADAAYEWEFNGINDYHTDKFTRPASPGLPATKITIDGELTAEQIALSNSLRRIFPAYLNSLGLKDENGGALTLDADGNGSFKDYVMGYARASAESAGAEIGDFDSFVKARTRKKPTPAFDVVYMKTPENELFGSRDVKYRHFSAFSFENSAVGGKIAEADVIKRLNPMKYMSDKSAASAKFDRVRHGTADRDTSLAISAMLTARLRNNGSDVDYYLPWGVPHSGDYDFNALFAWVAEICVAAQ